MEVLDLIIRIIGVCRLWYNVTVGGESEIFLRNKESRHVKNQVCKKATKSK